MTVDFELCRRVQVWRYSVGHSELYLMSPKAGEHLTRWCALLKPAKFISLPTIFDCDRVRSVVQGDDTRFEFVCGAETHFVIASAFFHAEDDEEYDAAIPFGVTSGFVP